jgi:DNA-binding ferritin-like protein
MKMIKNLILVMMLAFLGASTLQADVAKGQKVYLKKFKSQFDLNGAKFAALHSQGEWEELFKDNAAGFIKEFSERFPGAAAYLSNPKTLDKIILIKDFVIEYANDSGNVPSC